MKKIAIVTLQPHTNYGGLLQAYALQTLLERRGNQVEIIVPCEVSRRLPWFKETPADEVATIMQHTETFVRRYLHTRQVSWEELTPADYDAYVVGSDQIWRYKIERIMMECFEAAFLDFTQGWPVKRIAYAPSFGLDSWEAPEELLPEVERLLAAFDAVSVRERSGVELCQRLLHRSDAVQVLDPTLLLAPTDYEALIARGETVENPGDMACYVLNSYADKTELIRRIAEAKGLTPFYSNSRVEQPSAPLAERIQPPVEQWLRSFSEARMVVTDSFHATVFSLLFRRPFIVTGNPGRGIARLQSILQALGLERHLVLTADAFEPNFDYTIPDAAYERLRQLRGESARFLDDALRF